MKRLYFGSPTGPFENWARAAFHRIELASNEDIERIFENFTVTGTYTETRSLDTDTATLADLTAFVATMVSDIKKIGTES